MFGQILGGSLRRRLSTLLTTVLLGSLGVGLSAPPAAAVDDHVIVTFGFDDGLSTQYQMLPVFAAHNAKATFYVNSGLVGDNGRMSWSQLRDLYAAGHEIAGHTAHHTPLTDVDPATARAEIEADITTLQAQGFPRPVSFAYPVGYYGPPEEQMVEDAGYASARTIDTTHYESAPPADPYAVRVVRGSLDGSEGLQALKNDVLAAEGSSQKTWLVYFMHDFYSPIDEEVGDFLSWLEPRASSGTVVKTTRDVMLPAGNQPPVAEAGPAQAVTFGSTVTLDGTGSRDPNADPLSYEWTQTGGPSVSLSNATAAKPTFTAPSTESTLTFRLTVGDGEFTASDTVTVSVVEESNTSAPTYRSSSSTGNDAWTTSATIPVPAGAATGDVVVATIGTWGGTAPAITPPPGFTLKATYSGGEDTVRVYWKRLTSPDTGTYQFSWSGGRWASGHAVAVSGAATSGDPIEDIDHAQSASSNTYPSTTVTTTGTPLLTWIGRNDEPTSSHTPPSGFTEVQDRDCTAVAYREPSAPGTFTASGASYSGSANQLQSVLVAVKGAAQAGNQAPVADAGPAQSVSTGSSVTLDGSGSSDPDGDALTYQWTQTGGASVSLSSATAAKPTFTAPSTGSTLSFRLTVDDGQATDSDTVSVTVTEPPPVNQAPVADAGPAQSVSTGSSVTLDGSGSSDPDGDALTYQWTQTGGASVSLSSATAAKPTFTAPSTGSTLSFRLTVDDGQATDSDTVSVTVTEPPPVNQAPVADAGPAQSVSTGSSVTLDGSGSSDPDGDALTYQWTQTGGASVSLSSATAAKPTFTAPSTGSTLSFRLTVDDGQATDSDTVSVTVTEPPPVNQAPVADAGPAQSVSTGSSVTLDGSGSSDPDGDALTYQWTQTGGASVSLSSATAAKPTFTAPSTGSTLSFRLTVDDGQATDSDTVSVTVTEPPPVNQAPVADAGPAQSVSTGSSVTLDGSGSSDPDGDALTYQWTQTGGASVSLSSATAAKPTFTAPSTGSTLSFRLTVDDGQATDSDTVTVTVNEPSAGAPTYRSSSSTGNDAWASSVSVPVPAGAAAGDVVVVALGTWGGSPPNVTAPSGFTLKAAYTASNNGGADTVTVYWKRLTGPDTGSYQFSWNGGRWSSGHAIAVSGAATSGDPIAAIDRAGSLSANVFPSTSVTTASTPFLAWIGRNDEPTSQHTPPTGFTEIQDKDCTTVAYREPTGPGTFTATGASYTGAANPLQAVLVAIQP